MHLDRSKDRLGTSVEVLDRVFLSQPGKITGKL